MPTPRRPLLSAAFVLLAALSSAGAASADGVRLVSSDDHGVTLRAELPAWTLTPAPGGRMYLRAGTLPETDAPGRPCLPFASTFIALPPGATPQAVVIGGDAEEVRENVRVALGGRPVLRPDGRDGLQPAREEVPAIADGPWPRAVVELGPPSTVRRQRMVAVRILPFRYDEASRRLWARRKVLVRVSWSGGGGAALGGIALPREDRHWDPVLQRAVLNYEQGRGWRAPARALSPFRPGDLFLRRPGAAAVRGAAAFDENAPEVRVQVDTTALYGLDFARLAANGYPAGVPVQEVSVHRHEFVEGQLTPYVTIELPIEVDDRNGNGIFDAGDRILVYAQSWVDRARPSIAQQHWGPADAIYATRLPGGAGLRIGTRPGWRNNGATPLASYPWTQRYEKNFSYSTFPYDTLTDDFDWTGLVTYYDRPDSFVFEANNLDAGRPVNVAIQLQGLAQATHWTWAHVKNGSGVFTSIADSVGWFGRYPQGQTLAATLAGAALTEGRTNAIGIWGKTGTGPPDPVSNAIDNVGLNWFDITYWRGYRALRGYLRCNSADGAGETAITATGFSDSTRLQAWDVTDPLDPRRLTGVVIQASAPGYTLALQDSVDPAAPRKYVILDSPRLPPPAKFAPVTRYQLENAPAVDIVYIVPEAMRGAVTALAALRQQEGLDTLVAPLEGIQDEFNGGRKADWAIRRFLKYAYDRWNTRFVLLCGDGSEDPLDNLGNSGVDLVPIHKIPGPVGVSTADAFAFETVPSDMWYGWALDNVDLGSAFAFPDLFIGRLPVKTLQQLQDDVAKLIAYEAIDVSHDYASTDTTQAWRRRMLLHSDDAFSTEGGGGVTPGAANSYCWKDYEVIFQRISDAVGAVIQDSSGLALAEPEQFRQSYLLRNEPYVIDATGDTCRPDIYATQSRARVLVAAPLLDHLNRGELLWNYQGHANEFLLAHEYVYVDGVYGNDKASFTNAGRPFFFAGFSCHPNAFARKSEDRFDIGPCIGEGMVNSPVFPAGGAIGAWASVGFELIPSAGAAENHLNVWMAKSLFSNPPRDPVLGEHGARVVLGEALVQAIMWNYWGPDSVSGIHDGEGFTYTLLGDPATRLTVGPPEIVVTANGQRVTDGLPVRLTSGGDTLRLEADIASNIQVQRIVLERTGAGGTTVVPDSEFTLTPSFPDTVGGGRRYHLVYVTRLSQATLQFTLRITDREGVTSSFRVVFSFETVLQASGVLLQEDSPVTPDAKLSLLVLSPGPVNPITDFQLQVDGQPQPFTASPARGDTTGRVWELDWTHAPYSVGRHSVDLAVLGSTVPTHHFRVESGMRLAGVVNFPDPFEETLGTRFLFTLLSDLPADVMIRVYTVSGRMIWEHTERGLAPGPHEWPWNGLDSEGQAIANGVYLYRLLATNARGTARHDSRLVKLRRPRHTEPTATTGP